MRKEGYYWVKMNNRWEVAFFNEDENKFERHLDDSYTYDNEFQEIDERIISNPNSSSDVI